MKVKEQLINKNSYKILIMFLILLLAFFFSICIGRYTVAPKEVLDSLISFFVPGMEPFDEMKYNVVMQVRMPRILLSVVIGAGLACSGASYQCIFGNPLVSPDILGVSAGAGFGASLAILLSAGTVAIQSQALLFGLIAVGIVLAISRVRKKTEVFMLVLSGVIVTALFEAFISMIKYVADPQDQLPAITVWLMGSLSSASYQDIVVAAVVILPCMIILFFLRWKMNLLSLNEDEARSLGIKVDQLRLVVIIVSTLMTAVSVSLCGIIGWIGLVIPHIGRFFVGNDHRDLIPSCILLGGTYLLVIDGIARSISAAELPISILTSIIGAPFFAFMLRKTMAK